MLEVDKKTLWLFLVDFYATHGAKKQQLTPLFLIIKKLLLVFYGLVCDQLSRNLRAKACISTTESRVARPFKVLFARKLLEEWKHPSRLYNRRHLIPVFFSCSLETTLSGNGERHLWGCHRESKGESQTILRKNLQGFFKWQFGVLKKCSNQNEKKGIASNFFPQMGCYKSIQQFHRRQFEEKFWRNTFCFFGLATFFKPQIVARKTPLIIKSIKQKENQ